MQRIKIGAAPVAKRYHVWNATLSTDGFNQISDAVAVADHLDVDRKGSVATRKVHKMYENARFGYFVRCNKPCTVNCYVSNASASNYATRQDYCLAANTPTSYEFTGEGEYWYVMVTPASTANNTFVSTYEVNI